MHAKPPSAKVCRKTLQGAMLQLLIVGTMVDTTAGGVVAIVLRNNNATRSGTACSFSVCIRPRLFHRSLPLLGCVLPCLTRPPLAATPRPFLGFPVVFEQIDKIGVVPHRWLLRPLPFESTSKRVGSNTEISRTDFAACSRPRGFRSIHWVGPGSCGAWAVEFPWRREARVGYEMHVRGRRRVVILRLGGMEERRRRRRHTRLPFLQTDVKCT